MEIDYIVAEIHRIRTVEILSFALSLSPSHTGIHTHLILNFFFWFPFHIGVLLHNVFCSMARTIAILTWLNESENQITEFIFSSCLFLILCNARTGCAKMTSRGQTSAISMQASILKFKSPLATQISHMWIVNRYVRKTNCFFLLVQFIWYNLK